jgi:hypothetical protein
MKKTTAKYLDAINIKLLEKYRYDDYTESQQISNMDSAIKIAIQKASDTEKETERKKLEAQKIFILLETAKKYLTPEEIQTAIALNATNEQLESLLEKRYEDSRMGETIEISCCSECDEYEMGERSCSCGNRRISAYAEGYYTSTEYEIYLNTEAY